MCFGLILGHSRISKFLRIGQAVKCKRHRLRLCGVHPRCTEAYFTMGVRGLRAPKNTMPNSSGPRTGGRRAELTGRQVANLDRGGAGAHQRDRAIRFSPIGSASVTAVGQSIRRRSWIIGFKKREKAKKSAVLVRWRYLL
jgi:hypothetical protein